jgi:mediator of RNA polymerase II transcription subunit 12
LEDISIFADILTYSAQAVDVEVLVAALDTITYHFDSLSAIGATGGLFKAYFAAYANKSRSNISMLEFAFSLLEVAVKLPSELSAVAVLRRDLVRLDRKYAINASSPVSDHMTDTLDPINPTFPNSLEQLLVSGNSMDEPTMVRIVDLLLQMLVADKPGSKPSGTETAQYLARVRTFNAKFFDGLLIKWIISNVTSQSPPKLSAVLPPLIGVGCVTFQALFTLIQRHLNSRSKEESSSAAAAALRFDMIELLKVDQSSGSEFLDTVSN